MSKRKKINRGGVMFIVIAALIIGMILFEATSLKKDVGEVLDTVETFITEESKYYILPENIREISADKSELNEFYETAGNNLKGFFYKDAATGVDFLVENMVAQLQQYGQQQINMTSYYEDISVEVIRKNSIVTISADGKEAQVRAEVKLVLNQTQMKSVMEYSYSLVKDDGKWYILGASSIMSPFTENIELPLYEKTAID